jgi:hypothetical protein
VKAALLPPGERTAATSAGFAQAAAAAARKPSSPIAPATRPESIAPTPVPATSGGQKKTGLIVAVAAVLVAAGVGSIYLFKGQGSQPPIVQPEPGPGGGGSIAPARKEPVDPSKRQPEPRKDSGVVERIVTPPVKPAPPATKIPFVNMDPFQPRFPYGFRMGEHAVTLREFNDYLKNTGQEYPKATGAGPDQPVVNVSKRMAVAFCAWAAGPGGGGTLPERGEAQMAASTQPGLALGKQVWELMAQTAAVRNPRPSTILDIVPASQVPPEELGFRCVANLVP